MSDETSYNYYNNTYMYSSQGIVDPSPSLSDCLNGSMDDYNSLEKAFGFSNNSDQFSSINVDQMMMMDHAYSNSSQVSSSSTEAGGADEDDLSPKKSESKGSDDHDQDGEESSKKVMKKGKKKGEKREKQPRFAFITKSEVDQLEDGYRWRKYGQKAVKNSRYPRSYYRCTTQRCTVKKRVERSYQDPSTVITTYEGQHNHPIPTTLRGNASGMFSSSPFTPSPLLAGGPTGISSFSPHHYDFLMQMAGAPHINSANHNQGAVAAAYASQNNVGNNNNVTDHRRRQLSAVDYGLLQDMVPPMFLKQEP